MIRDDAVFYLRCRQLGKGGCHLTSAKELVKKNAPNLENRL